MRAAIFVDAGYLMRPDRKSLPVKYALARKFRLNRWLEEPEKHYVRNKVRKRATAQAQS